MKRIDYERVMLRRDASVFAVIHDAPTWWRPSTSNFAKRLKWKLSATRAHLFNMLDRGLLVEDMHLSAANDRCWRLP